MSVGHGLTLIDDKKESTVGRQSGADDVEFTLER